MNSQPALLSGITHKRKVQKGEVVFSLSFDERKIIRAIMELYNDGEPFDLDPTYSRGRFWTGLPQPVHKFDLAPQTPETRQASSDALPFEDGELGSIMFDPPFVIKNQEREGAVLGKIEKRFSGYKTIGDLQEHYYTSLQEFYRILRPGGLLAFKCQDMVTGGRNYPVHAWVIEWATENGFRFQDIFILGNKNVLLAPNLANQQHARKSHSYFLVFRK